MGLHIMNFILSIISGVIIGWIIRGMTYLYDSRGNLDIAIKAIFYRNRDIRLSLSYIFRIEVEGKYLLVKGNRITQYQPVGGAYKMLPSFQQGKRGFKLLDDNCIPIDQVSKDDLRVRLKGKKLMEFLKWFTSRKNREVGVHREFYEEMIATKILPYESYKNFTPEFLKSICTGIRDSVKYKIKELNIYDVYEIKLSESEIKSIYEFLEKNPKEAILVNSKDIESGHILIEGVSHQIGGHTEYLL